jgi:hypothetical protein
MLVKKLVPPSSFKPIEQYSTVYIWCSDGWAYDTTNQIRKRYSSGNGFIRIEEEPTERKTYSDIQQIEKVHVFILKMSPKTWIERGDTFEEMFEQLPN